jgi:hypothetical protein
LIAFLPAAGSFQRVDDLARHISLIVLGEDGIGRKYPACTELAFRNDSLPFPEEVRDNALILHGDVGFPIRHREPHEQVVATLYAARPNKAANAHAGARRRMFLGNIGRRIKENDRIS